MNKIQDALRLLGLSLRNVLRNGRRSGITIASICVGTVTLILLSGYILVMEAGLKANAIQKEYGHLQVAKRGYFDDDSTNVKLSMTEAEYASVEEFLSGLPRVDGTVKRLQIAGMIGNEFNSTYFAGICDETGTLVSMVPQVIEGLSIDSAEADGIVLGIAMAERLRARVGDSLLLFFSSPSGSQEAINVTVKGIYKGLLREQEMMMVYLPLETAWSLMLENRVHRLMVFLDDEKRIPEVTAELDRFISANGLNLEVRTWDRLAVMYKQMIAMFGGMVFFVGVIIFIVIIFGISNTMYMVVTDRTQEIGTLRAIGNGKLYIVAMLFFEGLFLGLIGSLAGIGASSLLIPLINSLHIMLPPGPGQTEPIPVMMVFNTATAVQVGFVTLGSAAFATLSPSLRASFRPIAEALRFA